MRRFSKTEYPLIQHTSITFLSISAFASLVVLSMFIFVLRNNIGEPRFEFNGENIACIICSFIMLSVFIVLFVYLVKGLKTQLAANNKKIVVLHKNEYLEFNIEKVERYTLTYKYQVDNEGDKYIHNNGLIKIAISGAGTYVVKGNNLNKTAKYLETVTGKLPEINIIQR